MALTAWPSVIDDDGSKTFGTIFNKALTDAIRASIEASVFSSTNPTVIPKDIIDEVVAARGSKSSVDARLDVTLNEDGTPKSIAGQATTAQIQGQLVSRNVALNGQLEDWSAGGALAPDSFVLAGVGATIARTGPAQADTFTFGAGTYAAKVSRVGNNATLLQSIISAAQMPANAECKGSDFAVLVKAKTGLANFLRIIVDDGVTTSESDYHTGGGEVENLTVVHTISATATKLEVYASFESSNGDGYVGGFTLVFSSLAPADWTPHSIIGDASATSKGLVSTGAQTFAGVKTFNSLPLGLGMKVFARSTVQLTKNADTTPADVVGLAFAVGANQEWEFEFVLFCIGNAAADHSVQLTGPAAPTAVRLGIMSTNVGFTGAVAAFSSQVGTNAAGVDEVITIRGILRNGANAGTVQLQYCQRTSNASNSLVYVDSFVVATRVA